MSAWATAMIVAILSGGLVAVVLAVIGGLLWLTGRAFRAQHDQTELTREMADRFMAIDWGNYIAGQNGNMIQIDRTLRRDPPMAWPDASKDAAAKKPDFVEDSFATDEFSGDMVEQLGPLMGDPAEEELTVHAR